MKLRRGMRILTLLMALLILLSTMLSALTLGANAAEDVEWRLVTSAPQLSFRDADGILLPGFENIPANSPDLTFDSANVTYGELKSQRYSSFDMVFSCADYSYSVYSDESNLPNADRMIAELEFQNQRFHADDIICSRTYKGYLQVDLFFENLSFFDDVNQDISLYIQYWRKNSDGDELNAPTSGTMEYSFTQAVVETDEPEEDKINIELVLPTEEEEPLDTVTPYVLVDECVLGEGLSAVYAGSSFDVNLTCRNSHESVGLDNVLMQVDVPDGLKLNHPSNTFYIGNIGDEERFQQTLNFSTGLSANVKNYPVGLTFSYEYVDEEKRKEDKISLVIQIPVLQQMRFVVDPVDTMKGYAVYETHEICSSFSNLTRGNIYNVTATLQTDLDCPQTVLHLGNLTAGEGGVAKFSFTPTEIGYENMEITYTYEDERGQSFQESATVLLHLILPKDGNGAKEVHTEYITDVSAAPVSYPAVDRTVVWMVMVVIVSSTVLIIFRNKK